VRDKLVPALLRGIASHHAGCLPAWKSLVERCFQKGLLKLVYATGALLSYDKCYDKVDCMVGWTSLWPGTTGLLCMVWHG
jgi:hypothetical protein